AAQTSRADAGTGGAQFHPVADMFPLMEGEEFDALGADIKANGLVEDIVLYEGMILDGRHRYRACLAAGVEPRFTDYRGDDPTAYVMSANIRRRHLNAEQRRDLLVKLVAAQPQKSDRAIAREAKVDHHQVSRARKKAEATGTVAPVEKRVGGDGKARKQPAKKARAQQQHDHAGAGAEATGEASPVEKHVEIGIRHAIGIAIKRLLRKWNVTLSALDRPEPGDHDVGGPRTVKKNVLRDIDGQNNFYRKVFKASLFEEDTALAEKLLDKIDWHKAVAEGYRKVFKLSHFEDTVRDEIRTAIEDLIQNLRKYRRDLAEKSAGEPEARSAAPSPADSNDADPETSADGKTRKQPAIKQPLPKPVKHDERVISPELGERVGRLADKLIPLD